ncbi:hypothetical protein [Actinoplanes friuliensis]|jgi:hypothetical protein|uniref:ESX-1 secretion-associated protein n=1 Tax=Actinoplanes friuliensis DSM 7358 TaxID=1246995 RepID=U5WDH5_9ACTN|nr:hypothetical protein [Actinoplanes friuliensis]AGZ46001.1 hypothetical protein AFR_38735 [Actinoplanes friuliensis DSM 7358]
MGDQINVETGGLNKFATDVRADTDNVTEPAVGRAKMPLDSVPFGESNVSGGVHAAKQRYAQSLSASTSNLTNYLSAARLLAAAAEKVAADFDAVDAKSAEGTKLVEHALWTAAQEARAARIAADRADNPRHGGPAVAM